MQSDATCLDVEAPQDRQNLAVEEYKWVERFRRVIEQRDVQAREQFDQHCQGMLFHWLFQHPLAHLALEHKLPESYVMAALSKFWQATTHPQRSSPTLATLAGILAYLRCCLNSTLLDAARQARLQQQHIGTEEAPSQQSKASGEDLWQSIERVLPGRRERLLMDLRYVRGERPEEIVASHPREFASVEEVYRLEGTILKHLRR